MPNENKSLADQLGEMFGGVAPGAGDKTEKDEVEGEVQSSEDGVGEVGEDTETGEEEEKESGVQEEIVSEVGGKGEEGDEVVEETPAESSETPTPTETVETPAVDDRDKTIETLRGQLNDLYGQLLEKKSGIIPPLPKAGEGQQPPVEQKPAAAPVAPSQPITFKLPDDVDFDDVMNNKETFEKVVGKAIESVLSNVLDSHTTKVLTSIPSTVNRVVDQTVSLREATKSFYDQNPDLLPVRKMVGAVADQLLSENPSLTLDQVFSQSAEKTRMVLGLKKQAVQTTTPQGGKVGSGLKPSFPTQRGTARPGVKPKTNSQSQQIRELIS
jgi:hypothetical protein